MISPKYIFMTCVLQHIHEEQQTKPEKGHHSTWTAKAKVLFLCSDKAVRFSSAMRCPLSDTDTCWCSDTGTCRHHRRDVLPHLPSLEAPDWPALRETFPGTCQPQGRLEPLGCWIRLSLLNTTHSWASEHIHKWCMNEKIHKKNRPLTFSVSHAVKEDPILAAWSVFDEGHIVAGLDAEHSKQLQFVSGQGVRNPMTHITFGNVQRSSLMGAPLRMRVHLEKNMQDYFQMNIQRRMVIFYLIYYSNI